MYTILRSCVRSYLPMTMSINCNLSSATKNEDISSSTGFDRNCADGKLIIGVAIPQGGL